MASSVSRSLRIRSFYGSLTAQWRINRSSFHSLPENSRAFPLDFCRDNQYGKYPAFAAINFRFLSTTATGSSINPSNSNAPGTGTGTSDSGSSEGNSGNSNDGKGSGGSQGKPVRGGPVSWMSFFLLLCTGVGLVYYYDREKKRHIEG